MEIKENEYNNPWQIQIFVTLNKPKVDSGILYFCLTDFKIHAGKEMEQNGNCVRPIGHYFHTGGPK